MPPSADLTPDHRAETGHHQSAEEHCQLQAARRRTIGVKVTLRGERMWAFPGPVDEYCLPRVRDFRGVSPDAFDGRGNYTLGLREQLIFPEIEYDKIDKIRGMEITIVTTASQR